MGEVAQLQIKCCNFLRITIVLNFPIFLQFLFLIPTNVFCFYMTFNFYLSVMEID